MKHPKQTRAWRAESGYALLMVVFMVATLIILASAVAPNLLTQGRRERETELAWRGHQYQRAIGLYYTKMGRYPTKLEDLTKQTNGVRFLRQEYKDPMNTDDGSWRFIYVGPNGQLIGSLKQTSLLQSLLSTPTLPGSNVGGAGGAIAGANGANGAAGSSSQFSLGAGVSNGSGTPGIAGAGAQPQSGALSPNPLESQPQPLSGTVIGGNIIGVGSKIKQPSLRVYDGGTTYQLWEFIWNPMQQVAIPGQQPAGPAPPTTPGAAGQASAPGTQAAPTPQNPGLETPQIPPTQ